MNFEASGARSTASTASTSTSTAATSTTTRAYATIDVKPGYQKLCGSRALDYVRFRHEDTDLVRAARQQDFIRQARSQVGVQRILKDRKEFLRLFGKYTDTDIHGLQQTLSLLKVIAFSAGHPLQEVRFRTDIGPSYVTSSPAQIRATVRRVPQRAALEGAARREPRGAAGDAGKRAAQGRRGRARPRGGRDGGREPGDPARAHVDFPVYFPRLRKAGSLHVDVPRRLRHRRARRQALTAYRIVARTASWAPTTGWARPGASRRSSKPVRTRKVGGAATSCMATSTGCASWPQDTAASYWVSNTCCSR